MESDLEQQQEELEALEAIFAQDFQKDENSPNAYKFLLDLDQDINIKSPRKFSLTFYLPPTYPKEKPVYQIHSVYCGAKKVDSVMLDAIEQGFENLFEPGHVVLFEWISWLKDYLEEHVQQVLPQAEEEIVTKVEDTVEKFKELAVVDEAHDRPTVKAALIGGFHLEEIPEIVSSEPLLDRKSTFVAHVAKVQSVAHVKAVLDTLLQNKKIAKATHNIMAYRIIMSDGRVLQDNDDDGETAAGGRLLHLMQILQVENVVVIVTRWFGGIHLGPDRFKDINNVARIALEDNGFVKNQQKSNKKK